MRTFVAPSGSYVLEQIILKTFFDVEFDPGIMIGSNVLLYLVDSFMRRNASLDELLTILHLSHLKHFSIEPLTVLVNRTPNDILPCLPFVEALAARLQLNSSNFKSKQSFVTTLIDTVHDARMDFRSRVRRIRAGFGMMQLIQQFLENESYRGLGWNKEGGITLFQVMIDILRNKFGPYIEGLRVILRKLRREQISEVLRLLRDYCILLPEQIFPDTKVQTKLGFFVELFSEEQHGGGSFEETRNSFADWLAKHLRGLFTPMEAATLWDVWYTGQTPFPSELINPSLRASIVSGLLFPHRFAVSDVDMDPVDSSEVGYFIWEHPDTSILFRRYLDSSKMINVYDWFGSFQLVLEKQRLNLKRREPVKVKTSKRNSRPSSPKKRGKIPGAKEQRTQDENGADNPDEGDEEWKIQIQSRFIRALHELDYLGFIKHTGRKADHLLKTTFDLGD